MNLDIDIALLGQQADTFLDSNLGKYLTELADAKREEAVEALVRADPGDKDANTRFRNDIRVADYFVSWLNEAVQSGKLAVHNLREMEAIDDIDIGDVDMTEGYHGAM